MHWNQLSAAVNKLNRIANTPLKNYDGENFCIGHYFWQSNSGGFFLCQISSEDGDFIELFHTTTQDRLYILIYAYIEGFFAGQLSS